MNTNFSLFLLMVTMTTVLFVVDGGVLIKKDSENVGVLLSVLSKGPCDENDYNMVNNCFIITLNIEEKKLIFIKQCIYLLRIFYLGIDCDFACFVVN